VLPNKRRHTICENHTQFHTKRAALLRVSPCRAALALSKGDAEASKNARVDKKAGESIDAANGVMPSTSDGNADRKRRVLGIF